MQHLHGPSSLLLRGNRWVFYSDVKRNVSVYIFLHTAIVTFSGFRAVYCFKQPITTQAV